MSEVRQQWNRPSKQLLDNSCSGTCSFYTVLRPQSMAEHRPAGGRSCCLGNSHYTSAATDLTVQSLDDIIGSDITGTVHLLGVSLLELDANGSPCNAHSAAVPLAKLNAHVRPWPDAAFFSQQRQGQVQPGRFVVNVRMVGFGTLTGYLALVSSQKLFHFSIGDVV